MLLAAMTLVYKGCNEVIRCRVVKLNIPATHKNWLEPLKQKSKNHEFHGEISTQRAPHPLVDIRQNLLEVIALMDLQNGVFGYM